MNNKYKTLYVGKEDKRITGSIHGIVKAHRMLNGHVRKQRAGCEVCTGSHRERI